MLRLLTTPERLDRVHPDHHLNQIPDMRLVRPLPKFDARALFYELYWKCERVIAPGLEPSQHAYERALEHRVGPEVDWLDIGCGHHVLAAWRSAEERRLVGRCRRLIGLDPDVPSLQKNTTVKNRVGGDSGHLPFSSSSFDLVTANMVVEHLSRPEDVFAEIHRVLRAGGVFLFHTPNANGYLTRLARLVPEAAKAPLIQLLESRGADDVFPTCYRANTEDALTRLARATGFEVQTLEMIATSAATASVPLLSIVELLWIRMLRSPRLRQWRPNMIVALRKPEHPRRTTATDGEKA